MDKTLLDEIKAKSREERAEFFKEHKSELFDELLNRINAGFETTGKGENPDSEVPYCGSWYSSYGYVCDGDHFCD